MVSVEWIGRPARLQVEPGERLLDALDERPQTGTTFACRSGHCGTCRVRVVTGADLVRGADVAERQTLQAIGAAEHERLACQLRVEAKAGTLRLVDVPR